MILRTKVPRKTSGIYQLQSKINEKIYIGSAVCLMKRKGEHLWSLNKIRHGNRYLQRHVNKYGIEDLKFRVIEYCLKEKLLEREQYYLDTLKPEYNISPTAGSSLGVIFTEERKQKTRGKNNPMYGIHRVGEDSAMWGKHHTEKTKEKMSKSHRENEFPGFWLNKHFSKEACKRMSNSKKGENNPFYDKHHSKETKEKLRKYHLNRKASEETKQKMKETRNAFYKTEEGMLFKQNLKNRRVPLEIKEKIRIKLKEYWKNKKALCQNM